MTEKEKADKAAADTAVAEKSVTVTPEELKSLLEEVTGAVVDEKLKAAGFDNETKRFAGAAEVKAPDERRTAAKERIGKFVSAVFHKDFDTLKEFGAKAGLTEGTGSNGGFMVPQEFAAEVNRIVEDFGLVPKLARKYPMKNDTLNIPRLASSVSISYPGEATAGTVSTPVFEQVQLVAKTAIGLTPMSNELLADANVDVVELLTELFAEAMAGDMDNQGLAGNGSPFTGILNDTGVTVVQPANGGGFSTFTGAATPDQCRTLISNIKPWALQGAAFIMHRTVWALIQTTKASTSGEYFISAANPVMTPNGAQQGFPTATAGTLWGFPVYLSDKMPTTTAVSTKFIIFGNLRHLYVGLRQDMQVMISQEATIGSDNLFAQNMSAVRIVYRIAVAVGLPKAFAVLKTAAS